MKNSTTCLLTLLALLLTSPAWSDSETTYPEDDMSREHAIISLTTDKASVIRSIARKYNEANSKTYVLLERLRKAKERIPIVTEAYNSVYLSEAYNECEMARAIGKVKAMPETYESIQKGVGLKELAELARVACLYWPASELDANWFSDGFDLTFVPDTSLLLYRGLTNSQTYKDLETLDRVRHSNPDELSEEEREIWEKDIEQKKLAIINSIQAQAQGRSSSQKPSQFKVSFQKIQDGVIKESDIQITGYRTIRDIIFDYKKELEYIRDLNHSKSYWEKTLLESETALIEGMESGQIEADIQAEKTECTRMHGSLKEWNQRFTKYGIEPIPVEALSQLNYAGYPICGYDWDKEIIFLKQNYSY